MRGLLTRVVCTAATAAAIVLLWSGVGYAQAVTGTLLGNITDQGGLGDARRNRDDHRDQHEHQPDGDDQRSGFYTFPSLKDGTYRVVAELSGFKRSCATASRCRSTRRSAWT